MAGLEPASVLADRILADGGAISAAVWIENRDEDVRAELFPLLRAVRRWKAAMEHNPTIYQPHDERLMGVLEEVEAQRW